MLFFWTAVFFRHNEWVMFAVMFVLDEKKIYQINLGAPAEFHKRCIRRASCSF